MIKYIEIFLGNEPGEPNFPLFNVLVVESEGGDGWLLGEHTQLPLKGAIETIREEMIGLLPK